MIADFICVPKNKKITNIFIFKYYLILQKYFVMLLLIIYEIIKIYNLFKKNNNMSNCTFKIHYKLFKIITKIEKK